MVYEDHYYRLLGIPTTASDLDLKKAYRRQAIRYHPDKNLRDPRANERFQEIGEAYQVLSDPALRTIYDKRGRNAVKSGAKFVDPIELFGRIFGGAAFSKWIGQVSLMKDIVERMEMEAKRKRDAHPAENHDPEYQYNLRLTDGDDWHIPPDEYDRRLHEEEARKLQEKKRLALEERVKTLGKFLTHRVAHLGGRAADSELNSLRLEVENLKLQSFGIPLLHAIGKVYRSKATEIDARQQWFGVPLLYHRFNGVVESITSSYHTFQAAKEAKIALQITEVEECNSSDEEGDEEVDRTSRGKKSSGREMDEAEKIVTGKLLAFCWESTKMEIMMVLRRVCDRVIYASDLSQEEQVKRANGLLVIAEVFGNARENREYARGDNEIELLVMEATKVRARSIRPRQGAHGTYKATRR